jgi:hypothetical protein
VQWPSGISTITFTSIESLNVFPLNGGDMYTHSSGARIWITGLLNRAQVRRRDGLKDDVYNLLDVENNVISEATFDEHRVPNIVSCLLMDDEIVDPPSPLIGAEPITLQPTPYDPSQTPKGCILLLEPTGQQHQEFRRVGFEFMFPLSYFDNCEKRTIALV